MRRNVIIFPAIYLVTYEFIVGLMQGGKLKNVFFPNMTQCVSKCFVILFQDTPQGIFPKISAPRTTSKILLFLILGLAKLI